MGKSKKHKSNHSSHDMRSFPSLPLDHSQRRITLIDGSQLKTSPSPQSPSVIKHFRHDSESGLRLTSPQDVYHTPLSANRKHENTQKTNRRNSMLPPGSTNRIAGGHHITTAHGKQNESSRASHKPLYPTIITSPVDPRDTYNFQKHIMAQNRQRNTRHQTFTATVPDSSDLEAAPDVPSYVKDPGDSNENDSSKHRQGKRKPTSESEDETDTSTEGRTDTETSDESTAEQDLMDVDTASLESNNGKHCNQGRQSDRAGGQVPRATMGREPAEKTRNSDKASMERAAKRAINNLTNPVKSEKRNDRIPASTLGSPDLAALRSLQSLIPPHVQQRAREVLESKTPKSEPKSNNANTLYHQKGTDIQHTLTAARILILQLSATRMGGGNSTTSPASTESSHATINNSHLLGEVLRILKTRDQTIQSLEMEVRDLRAQLELTAEKK